MPKYYKFTLWGLGILIFLFALTEGVEATSKSSFCLNCHQMQDSYQSWSKGVHKKQACLTCHEKLGISGMAATKLDGLRKLTLHVFGFHNHDEKVIVANENCRKCHTFNEAEYKKRKPKADGIYPLHSLKYHKTHSKRKTCQECHPGIGHGRDLQQGLNKAMPLCINCHNHQG